MPSRYLVDPELAQLLEFIPDVSLSTEKLEPARATMAALTEAALVDPDTTVTVTEYFAPGPEGAPDVRILLYRPEGLPDKAPAMLYIHGGGFVMGAAELGDPRNRSWASALNCVIASVDYRLAPETPFPGGLDDCYAALEWLSANADALGLDVNRIATRGESGGGGLSASLALMARDLSGPKICFQLLIYPMLDDRTCAVKEGNKFSGQYCWDRGSNTFAWRSWLGAEPGAVDIPYLAAPARATDLRELPPTLICTAALDLFIDENLDFARRLIRAGVPTEVYVAPGAYHGFDSLVPDARVSHVFTDICLKALARAFQNVSQ